MCDWIEGEDGYGDENMVYQAMNGGRGQAWESISRFACVATCRLCFFYMCTLAKRSAGLLSVSCCGLMWHELLRVVITQVLLSSLLLFKSFLLSRVTGDRGNATVSVCACNRLCL